MPAQLAGLGPRHPFKLCAPKLRRLCASTGRSSDFEAEQQEQRIVAATDLPTQGDALVAGIDPIDYINRQLQDILKPPSTEDMLAVSNMPVANSHRVG